MEEAYEETVEQSVSTVADVLGITSIPVDRILPALIMLIVCLIVIKVILHLVDRFLDKGMVEESLHVFVRSAFKFTMLFLTILLVAASLGINITSLVAVFSIMGLAVSLAVQGVLSNLAGGLMVLLSKPFKVGDYISVAGIEGTVDRIDLTHTIIRNVDNKISYVPNGDISASQIVNYTMEDTRRVDLVVTASYDAKVDDVYDSVKSTIKSIGYFKEDPAPFVRVSNYLDSSIEYTIRAWVDTADYWDAYFALLEGVKRGFDNKGIEMTYNHINVHMMEK